MEKDQKIMNNIRAKLRRFKSYNMESNLKQAFMEMMFNVELQHRIPRTEEQFKIVGKLTSNLNDELLEDLK